MTNARYRLEIENLLASFVQSDDLETDTASFRTKVPSVAPEGFLNVLFKPIGSAHLKRAKNDLTLPLSYSEFLIEFNGLRLFFDKFCVLGIGSPDEQVDRSGLAGQRPVPIQDFMPASESRLRGLSVVPVGWYGFDGSIAYMKRDDESVVFLPKACNMRGEITWTSLSHWMFAEVERIASLYSPTGILQYPSEFTIPHANLA